MSSLVDRAYIVVQQSRPDLYRRAVEIGHLGDPAITGPNTRKRCRDIEASVMLLICDVAGLEYRPCEPK